METATKMKLKKGDQVVVIAGKDKGKTGTITKVSPSTNKVVVAGINVIKKATKPNPQTGEGGGLIEKEAPIHASNVMFLDPATGKGTRKRPQ
ncbi:50S ribosomal protein L24 [Geothrix rubra]|jgi:large subunit ribosomal protein L24|uniref:Large ribosomal subunit protein uL24 n=2 Tax=Geothrix rubra TaxID=2927977 RepID=A0ABQ5Q8I5_9BACT|nr:50S ribosomal protein L24 [Geothrix rubra]GLH70834.1 50S ribosomal protein L24 [Geothrix rubra]